MAKEKKEKTAARPKKEKPRLEAYMLAADNPIGHKQLRPIFRRKRSREVLTREQVTAIKRGRRLLRKEMKEQGLKNRVDFEVTATNLGLYFDRNRLLFPILLWFWRGNTVAKVLATTAVLATTVTITEPVIRYIERIIIEIVEVEKIVEEDRFVISLDEDLFSSGFTLSETSDFAEPSVSLRCEPAEGVPCISITSIPDDVHTIDGNHHDTYFAYTFYARYESTEGGREVDYSWELELTKEEKDLSRATWIMVFEGDVETEQAEREGKVVWVGKTDGNGKATIVNDRMRFYAEAGSDGASEVIPEPGAVNAEGKRIGYVDVPLQGVLSSLTDQYSELPNGPEYGPEYVRGKYYGLYQTEPEKFISEKVAARGEQRGVLPGEIHRYTVVIWLEGDDPECTDEMMGGHIGMNFQIRTLEERHEDGSVVTQPTRSIEE